MHRIRLSSHFRRSIIRLLILQFALETAQSKVKEGDDLVARQQTQITHLNKMVDDAAAKYSDCQDQVTFSAPALIKFQL